MHDFELSLINAGFEIFIKSNGLKKILFQIYIDMKEVKVKNCINKSLLQLAKIIIMIDQFKK